ncbi:MAG: hypothetical protein ACYDAG_14050, partial [Chloroflexota bacterium]
MNFATIGVGSHVELADSRLLPSSRARGSEGGGVPRGRWDPDHQLVVQPGPAGADGRPVFIAWAFCSIDGEPVVSGFAVAPNLPINDPITWQAIVDLSRERKLKNPGFGHKVLRGQRFNKETSTWTGGREVAATIARTPWEPLTIPEWFDSVLWPACWSSPEHGPFAAREQAAFVGWDLPGLIGSLARSWHTLPGGRGVKGRIRAGLNAGATELRLAMYAGADGKIKPNRHKPGVLFAPIDSRRAAIRWYGFADTRRQHWTRTFWDVRQQAEALAGDDLEPAGALCREFLPDASWPEGDSPGAVLEQVHMLAKLQAALSRELASLNVPGLRPERIYGSASITRAVLRTAGVAPDLLSRSTLTKSQLGQAASGGGGGLVECPHPG